MKWFAVVVMLFQPDGTTPLWIPYVSFDTKEQCLDYVVENQFVLFGKAIEQYRGAIEPDRISCVNKKVFEELVSPKKENKEVEELDD